MHGARSVGRSDRHVEGRSDADPCGSNVEPESKSDAQPASGSAEGFHPSGTVHRSESVSVTGDKRFSIARRKKHAITRRKHLGITITFTQFKTLIL